MSNAPVFDQPDHFNAQYVKLADLDGSGTTGIVYLAKDSFKIYLTKVEIAGAKKILFKV